MSESVIYQPEQLNIWDRIFNRYKKIFIGRGYEKWHKSYGDGVRAGEKVPGSEFMRDCAEYHKVDRLTGGYTLVREYL